MTKNEKIGIAVVSVIAFLFIGRETMQSTRGYRNNNPGNIKESAGDRTQWVGERATDDDAVFEEFETDQDGINAIGHVIDSYRNRGIVTVGQIINTYAPPSENITSAYLSHVLSETGWNEGYIPQKRFGDYVPLVAAIIKHENGFNKFSNDFIAASLAMA